MSLFDRNQPTQRERSSDERERARAEREARRAAREGRPADAAIPPPLETPPPDPGLAPPPPTPAQPPTPSPPPPASTPAPPPAPVAASPAQPAMRVASPPAPSRPSPSADGDGFHPTRRAAPADAPSVVFDDHVSEDWSQVDTPERRTLRGRRRLGRGGGDGGLPPLGADGDPGAPRKRRRWPLALLLLAIAAILAAGWVALSVLQPLHGSGGTPVSVVIPKGAGLSNAADVLASRGVISSAFFFKLRAKLDGSSAIKPGSYRLAQDSSYSDVLATLTRGPPPAKTTDITITEGRTITEANRLLRKTSLRGSYATAAARSTVLRPQDYGAPRSVHTKEGFLFPSTYKLRENAPVSALVTKQLQNFRRQFARVNLAYARTKKLSAYDVLILASMVEREAAVAKDRPLVASVIYNRLKQGIPLGIDATIRYQLDNWQRPLLLSELKRDTPFNTRLRQGLPPTPIGNPGLASIEAAAHPARTSFLYFVVKPCGKGEHAFLRTDAEFQRAATQYERARQAQGKSPVRC